MKINGARIRAVLLLLLVAIPFLWNQSSMVVSAATPTMKDKAIEIVGKDQEYQLEINDKVAQSKYKWSTSKASVARVSSKGLVITVGKGTATIKCQITYSNGKTKTLSTKVTVVVPATDVSISNTNLVNDAHVIKVGESFDFNRSLTPKDSSYKTYWSIGHAYKDEDKGSIKVDSSGVVTGLKPGKVTLYASAAKNKELSKKREIYDSVIIEVVAPSFDVTSAEIINSKELKVIFDSAVNPNTVIEKGNLSPNIALTLGTDVKKNLAKEPGDLSASLSKDGTILTITPTENFEGNYYLNFNNKITSLTGVALKDEVGIAVNYIDNVGPAITTIVLDDTGFVNTVSFTEPVDISKMKIVSALAVGAGSTDPNTTNMLKNNLNYVLSPDKKALSLNMSNIAKSDHSKTFVITVQGITDITGNEPAEYFLSFYVFTDSTPKPQARPLMIQRTGYKTVTVTFDRSIQNPGFGYVANGATTNGILDSEDNKKVHYSINDADALRTGTQVFSIGFWSGYNVMPTDLTAESFRQLSLDFTVEKTKPYLTSFGFDPSSKVLTITYSEPVSTIQNTGYISYKVNTNTNEIDSGTLVYTRILSSNPSEVKLSLSNIDLNGVYTFTLFGGFVEDSFKNYSESSVITINNMTSSTSELPGPYLVAQSKTNLNQIIVNFANRIDLESAQQLSNYNIPGVQLLSAEVVRNTSASGAEIVLTVAQESIQVTAERPMIISGIRGLNGNYGEMSTYSTTVMLKDNVKPVMMGNAQMDTNQPNVIRINFNEEIQGTPIFQITQQGSVPVTIGNSAFVSGNTVVITLTSFPANMTYLRIDMIAGSIADMSGNTITTIPTTGVVIQF